MPKMEFEWFSNSKKKVISAFICSFELVSNTAEMKYLKWSSEKMHCFNGYHFYKSYWYPEDEELLHLSHEKENPFDVFAIKATENGGLVVGHLLIKISRITKDRGSKMTASLVNVIPTISSCTKDELEFHA